MTNVLLGLALIIDITVGIVSVSKHKSYAPYTVFALFWSIILAFYFVGKNSWYEVDAYVAFIILFGNILFLIATYLTSASVSKVNREDYSKNDNGLDYIGVLILTILTLLWLSRGLVDRLGMLLRGMSFNEIYIYYRINGTDNGGSLLSTMLSILIARPFTYCSICILAYELLKNGTKKKWVIITQIIILVMSIIQSGKRSMPIYFIFVIFIESIRLKKFARSRAVLRKHKLIVAVLIAVVVIAVFWISGRRDTDVLKSASVYLAGGIPSFSIRSGLIGTNYFGLGLLHGLLVPTVLMLHGIFKVPYPDWYLSLDSLVEAADYIQIGSGQSINAFNTLYYTPFIDGGIVFVIIEMILIGSIYGVVYKRLQRNETVRYALIYQMLMIGIAGSMYTLYFTQYPYALAFFYILFLTRRKTVGFRIRIGGRKE